MDSHKLYINIAMDFTDIESLKIYVCIMAFEERSDFFGNVSTRCTEK